ncbi:MAG: hypothetical protein O7C75_04705 [Verrucomicrobia bacterium]|nr:hypothetical protein [Verrucomicrobiota bacterium]
MAELSEDYVETLKNIRGEFENTKVGRIGNRVLAHVFSTVFPILLLGYLILWSEPQWPLRGEQWLFIVFALATLGTGLALHRSINSRYIFDDDGVREIGGKGKLKESISWEDLARVDYRESRGIKSFTFKGKGTTMHVEFYKSLSEAFAQVKSDQKPV